MGFPRVAVAVGALLLVRAALTVVRGRKALAGAGEVTEGFSLPLTAIVQALAGSCICLLGLMRHLGGLRPIRQVAGKPMRWDAQHERPGFKSFYTRMRYLSPLLARHEGPPANLQQQQEAGRDSPRVKKLQ